MSEGHKLEEYVKNNDNETVDKEISEEETEKIESDNTSQSQLLDVRVPEWNNFSKEKINNNNNYNVTQNNNGINYTKDINDDDDHIIKVTMEEQRFKELEKLSEKITNYLLHIILIDNDKYFKETIFSYFNSFNSLINYQLTTCNDLNEMESIIINNSKNGGITTITKDNYQEDFKKVIIICTEDQFYNVEEKSKILFSNGRTSQRRARIQVETLEETLNNNNAINKKRQQN
ncbi:hypothetical protein ABK040_012811 [Willaertia magna]